MPDREIPRDEWREFLDAFSRKHQGRLVTLEMLGPDVGDRVEAEMMPLVGIIAELREPGEDEIQIIVGDTPETHISDTIQRTEHVRLMQGGDDDEALEIAALRVAALIRLRPVRASRIVGGMGR
jgi:hypothetical protein